MSSTTPSTSVKQPQAPSIIARTKPILPRQPSSTDDTSLNEKIDSIRREHEKNKRDEKSPLVAKATAEITVKSTSASRQDSSEDEEDDPNNPKTPVRVTHFEHVTPKMEHSMQPSKSAQNASTEHKLQRSPAVHSISATEDITNPYTRPRESGGYDWKKYLIPDPGNAGRRDSTDDEWNELRQRFARSQTNPELIVTSKLTRLHDSATSSASKPAENAAKSHISAVYKTSKETSEARRSRYKHAGTDSNESSVDSPNDAHRAHNADRRNKYKRKGERSNTTMIGLGKI